MNNSQTKPRETERKDAVTAAGSRAIPRRRVIVATMIGLGGSTFVGLVLIELGLRLSGIVTDIPRTFYDPVTGPRNAPNQSGRWIAGNNINARFHYNAQGWNSAVDYSIQKPAGTLRVCLIGDSQIESLQVELDQTMQAVAQKLTSRPDRPTQWWGFGNSGWGTAQQTQTIRHYMLDFQPDVVILLFVQNDPFDNSPYLARIPPHVPCYFLDADDRLAFRPPTWWEPRKLGRFAIQSATFRYFFPQKNVFQRHSAPIRDIGGLPLRSDTADAQDADVPGLSKLSRREREAKTWKLIESLLQLNRDECARRGAIFAVAFRGWSPEIEQPLGAAFPVPPPRETDPYCLNGRLSEMGREQVGPICQKLGIPYLDLTDALKDGVARTGKSSRFPDDNHLSVAGHAAAGEALARWADEMLGHATNLKPVNSRHR